VKQQSAAPLTAPRPKHLGNPSLARALDLSIDRTDLPLKAVGADMDADAPLVCRWRKVHEPHAPTVLHLVAAANTPSRTVAVDVHRWVGACGPRIELEAIRAEGRGALQAVLELDAWAAKEQLRRRGAR
jgi:hypothetical protein